jgi:hypothetical protein
VRIDCRVLVRPDTIIQILAVLAASCSSLFEPSMQGVAETSCCCETALASACAARPVSASSPSKPRRTKPGGSTPVAVKRISVVLFVWGVLPKQAVLAASCSRLFGAPMHGSTQTQLLS